MNSSIRHERRGASPLSSQRKITIRPNVTTPNEVLAKSPFQSNQSLPTFNEEPKHPALVESSHPIKPFKIKKSDLQPPDTTAPIFIQFNRLVKQAAFSIFRGIGCQRRDLRAVLDETFDDFFAEFDTWRRNTHPQSLRKDTGKLDIEILRRQVSECNTGINPLRVHCHLWKSYKDYDDIQVPQIDMQEIPPPQLEIDDEMANTQGRLIEGLDSFSRLLQRDHILNSEINEEIDDIREFLQFSMSKDYQKQKKLRELLNTK